MFPPCSEEELYVLAKAHVFEAVLGEFPPDVVHSVSFMHQGLFNSSDELKGFYDLSEDLRGFLCSIKTIQVSLASWFPCCFFGKVDHGSRCAGGN